jgi:hypothetical protein
MEGTAETKPYKRDRPHFGIRKNFEEIGYV